MTVIAEVLPVSVIEPAPGRVARPNASLTEDVPTFRGTDAPGRRAVLQLVLAWLALAAAAVVVGRLLGASTDLDRTASDWFVDHRSPTVNAISRAFSLAGDTYTVIAIASLAVVIGVVRHHREGLIVLVVAMVGEVTMFLTITALVSRDRPDVPRLDGAPPTSSFPSGHSFAAIVLWGALAVVVGRCACVPWLRRVFLWMMVLMPVAIGLSRLSRGMHHLTDVLASVVLGIVWLIVVVRVFPAHARRARVEPAR